MRMPSKPGVPVGCAVESQAGLVRGVSTETNCAHLTHPSRRRICRGGAYPSASGSWVCQSPLRFEFAGRNQADALPFRCHDTGVILGRANKASCAGGAGFAVWSLGGKDGGSRANPRFLYNQVVPVNPPNVDNATGHSAAFSWDGETISFGHEPGGGLQARCKANGEPVTNGILGPGVQTSDMKSFFFYETDSGALQGKWTHTRPQSEIENCVSHIPSLTSRQLGQLYNADGRRFDRLFLRFMTFHHLGALTMVQELREAGGGAETEIGVFTNHVEADQGIEIARMRELYASLR